LVRFRIRVRFRVSFRIRVSFRVRVRVAYEYHNAGTTYPYTTLGPIFPIAVRLLQNNERSFPLIFTIFVVEYRIKTINGSRKIINQSIHVNIMNCI
jgi:hypothetical protein